MTFLRYYDPSVEVPNGQVRSLLCKSQEFRVFVRDVFKTEDVVSEHFLP